MFMLIYEKKDGATEEFPLEDLPVVAGRLDRAGVCIRDPSVSREHIRLFMRDDVLHLADLNSSNGTRVNGKKVTRAELKPGDEIRLGNAVLKLALEEGAGAVQELEDEEIVLPDAGIEEEIPVERPSTKTEVRVKSMPSVEPAHTGIKIKQDILQYHKKDPRKGRSFLLDDFSQYGGLLRLVIGFLFIAVVVGVFFLCRWLGENMTPDGMGLDDGGQSIEESGDLEEE